ncbi:MAG: hypothetical protein ABI137_11620 [Antricoccus sp.]
MSAESVTAGIRELMHQPGRVAAFTVGGLIVAYGVFGLLSNLNTSQLIGWGAWVVGGPLLHDLVIAPLSAAVALGLRRVVPALIRPWVTIGFMLSAMLTFIALPSVLRLGNSPALPSALPRNYAHGLLWYLAVVWFAMAVAIVITVVRRRAHR